jgi:hypothetical protein
MSATTKMARSYLVRGDWGEKRPTLKRDPQTGKEMENKVKWDKRYFVLADTKPATIYWYKNEAVRAFFAQHLHLRSHPGAHPCTYVAGSRD